MNITLLLQVAQIVIAVLLIVTILLQQKGSGLGGVFGGEGNTYSSRRGAEQLLFRATIALAVLFFAAAIATVLLS